MATISERMYSLCPDMAPDQWRTAKNYKAAKVAKEKLHAMRADDLVTRRRMDYRSESILVRMAKFLDEADVLHDEEILAMRMMREGDLDESLKAFLTRVRSLRRSPSRVAKARSVASRAGGKHKVSKLDKALHKSVTDTHKFMSRRDKRPVDVRGASETLIRARRRQEILKRRAGYPKKRSA